MGLKTSIVTPSKNYVYLRYLLCGLSKQTVKPSEIVLVIKDCSTKVVERICSRYSLRCKIIEQKKGFFTRALNVGKKEASGDVIIFTDDDAIPPKRWIERYIKLYKTYPSNIAGISSRDIYIDINKWKILCTSDDTLHVRLYRWLIRTWYEQPHPLLKKYRLGVYLTKKLNIAYGPYLPYKTCYSLPFRGVNMSFRRELIEDIWFPEHPLLKRALGNEQYFGLRLVLKNYDLIYTPTNPVLHIIHESLSRSADNSYVKYEFNIMKKLYKKLLDSKAVQTT